MNRDALSRRLVSRGYDVIVAADGTSALAAAGAGTPDLILMDLGMAEMDGWECARRLKGNAATRHIPIIALTAHAMSDDREKALQAGCDEFDTKPIDFAGLLQKITALLALRALAGVR